MLKCIDLKRIKLNINNINILGIFKKRHPSLAHLKLPASYVHRGYVDTVALDAILPHTSDERRHWHL